VGLWVFQFQAIAAVVAVEAGLQVLLAIPSNLDQLQLQQQLQQDELLEQAYSHKAA